MLEYLDEACQCYIDEQIANKINDFIETHMDLIFMDIQDRYTEYDKFISFFIDKNKFADWFDNKYGIDNFDNTYLTKTSLLELINYICENERASMSSMGNEHYIHNFSIKSILTQYFVTYYDIRFHTIDYISMRAIENILSLNFCLVNYLEKVKIKGDTVIQNLITKKLTDMNKYSHKYHIDLNEYLLPLNTQKVSYINFLFNVIE